LGAALWCGVLLNACGPDAPRDDRPLVAVSVAPLRFVVRAIAGDRVRVEVMIPPGANPHSYEPALQQARALGEAAVYVKVGHPNFPLETVWLDRILSDAPDLVVVDASAGLPRRDGDPHLWLVPRHVEHMAVAVEAALEKVLPAEQETLRTNVDAFRSRVRALDREIRGLLEARKGAEFFVFHPAWGDFAEEYGLRQVAVEHEHKEPDPHELAELIQHAKASQVRVIFVQPEFDRKSAQTLAQEAGARVEILDPLAEDWEANLRHAARALAEGLSP
jgi:zinc transport system substrate-binding protein